MPTVQTLMRLGLLTVTALMLSAPLYATENKHDIDTLKVMRDICMERVGEQPFCACTENAVKKHIPSGTLSVEGDALKLDENTSEEVYDAVNAAVAECGKKYAHGKWEG